MSEALNLVQAFNTVQGILGDINCFAKKKKKKKKEEGRIAQIV